MFASESVAIESSGFEIVRDVKPGEAIFITLDGLVYEHVCVDSAVLNPCIFEYVYLARPDSTIDGVRYILKYILIFSYNKQDIFFTINILIFLYSVYRSRQIMGVKLAERIKRDFGVESIDIIVPVPDTSRTCAMTCSEKLKIPYREGFIKNRYIARTFIMPGQVRK